MRSPRILVTGYFGRGNLGDDLMRDALAGHLARLPGPPEVGYLPFPPLGPGLVRRLPAIARALRGADVLALAGGTHFHGAMGRRTDLVLAAHLALLLAARLAGCRVVLYGVGVEVPSSRLSAMLVAATLRLPASIAVRDPASRAATRALGRVRRVHEGLDLVLTTAPVDGAAPAPARGVGTVAVALPGVASMEGVVPDLADRLARAARDGHVTRVLVLPLHAGARSRDAALAASLERRLLATGVPVDVVVDRDRQLEVLATAGLVIAGRYHAAVPAFLAGTPLVMVPYQRKCEEVAGQLGIRSLAGAAGRRTDGSLDWPDDLFAAPGRYRALRDPDAIRDRAVRRLEAFSAAALGLRP